MTRLGAQAVTCFVGHEHSPGDLRLAYQRGLRYPETLYGVLSQRTLRQFLAAAGSSTLPRLERYRINESESAAPVEFRRTPYREGYFASLQRLWRTGGCPNAMLFFNFRGEVEGGFERSLLVEEVFSDLEETLIPIFTRFWDHPAPPEFTGLMRAAESIGSRIFFEVKDFEFMTRSTRNKAFGDLLTATIEADSTLRALAPWWHLYVPVTLTTKPVDTRLVKLAQSRTHLNSEISSELAVGSFNSVESWVYWRDTALRITPQCLRRGKSGFRHLLGLPQLSGCEALLSLPFTSEEKVFAVATMGFPVIGDFPLGDVAVAMNRAIRSLWFNGRRISRAWSEANERRHAKSAK